MRATQKKSPAKKPATQKPRARKLPGGGNPPYEPTEHDRQTVRVLSGYGVKIPDIAATLQITRATLAKYFARELVVGAATANSRVGQMFYQFCVGAPAEFDASGNMIRAERQPDLKAIMLWVQRRLDFAPPPKEEQKADPRDAFNPNEDLIPENADLSELSDEDLTTLAEIIRKATGANTNARRAGNRAARH